MSKKKTQPQLDQQLCFAVYSANLAIASTYKPILAAIGLTYPQYVVMLALWSLNDGSSVMQLADTVHMDAATLSPLLKRLEVAGLVTRTRAHDDERRVWVTLTEMGRALGEKANMVSSQFGAACAMADSEIDELRRLLVGLRQQLELVKQKASAVNSE